MAAESNADALPTDPQREANQSKDNAGIPGIPLLYGLEPATNLAAIVEQSHDAIISKSTDGIIWTWNGGAERMFGYTAAEAIGRSIALIIPADRMEEESEIQNKIRQGQPVDHYETVRKTKTGHLLDISVSVSPLRNRHGEVVGASKIARDITEQKLQERQLQAAKEAAEAANAAKERFLAALSHELRTPLTPVLAAASFLERRKRLPPDVAELVNSIRRGVEIESRLIDDLLDLTRIARRMISLHFEAVDIHAQIRAAVEAHQTELAAKELTLTISLDAKSFSVWADPGRIQQVLIKLLGNAISATPENGHISIRTVNDGQKVIVIISDDGRGIDPKSMSNVFNVFEFGDGSAQRRGPGLGIDLAICKSLIEMHKGTITAISEGVDKGASFLIELATIASPTSRTTVSSSDSRKILLVEDHPDTQRVLSRVLLNMGHVVTSVGGVKAAIAAAETQNFDLLISDIGLPDGSGNEVAAHVLQQPGIRGIALSGLSQDEDRAKSQQAGFDIHLTKPISVQLLQDTIRQVLAAN